MKNKILIVDDDHDICVTLSKILTSKGYETIVANNSKSALTEIKKVPVDLILLDVWLEGSDKDGLELLKIIKNYNPFTPVILISGHANVEMAVKAVKEGAFYFIEKPFKSEKLFLLIERAIEDAFLKNKYQLYKEEIDENEEFIGNTNLVNNLKKKIKQIANSNTRVLITGETGSGKKLVAKLIHNLSKRSSKPFITINCSLLNLKNFDKTFFGSSDQNINNTLGYIQKANQGTIYLNEVCDLEYLIQGKITNFLQKETFSTDGSREDFNANIRFISSTNKNINDEIQNKTLRKDLLYRLNVTSIEIPPIRNRREDIPLIVDHFIGKNETKYLKKIKLSDDVYSRLQTIEWPGNVRQIKNFVEWLYISYSKLSQKNEVITSKMLPNDILNNNDEKNETDNNYNSMMNLPIKDARKNFERQYLINQVKRFGWNISKTANFIGMERSALHRKIKEVGIKK
tara:strand:- start:493 stop:1866 length:1374 start_codon:yes stop_codon:yes gene_type:complete